MGFSRVSFEEDDDDDNPTGLLGTPDMSNFKLH